VNPALVLDDGGRFPPLVLFFVFQSSSHDLRQKSYQ
jgi:hypothetical protein